MLKLKRWIIEIAILSLVFAGVGYAAHETKFSGLRVTDLTASRAVFTDAEKDLASSATTATEIGYVSGLSSAIQGQIDGKAAVAHKDTHDPEDGADPLDTATALEISVVVAASAGASHSLARADHVHAINHAITDNHIATYDGTQNSGETVRMTADGLESRTDVEMKTQLAYLQAGDAINMADALLTRAKLLDYGETINAIGNVDTNTHDIDLVSGNVVTCTLTGNPTFTFSNPPASGTCGSFTLIVTQDASPVIVWPGAVDWTGGTAPTLTTSGIDTFTFFTLDAGTIWYGYAAGLEMKSP